MLETLALTVGRQVATHATKAWLRHRKAAGERKAQLTDLLASGLPDQFARRKLARQLEDIGDQVARRLTPLLAGEFSLPDNEREAALSAVVDALEDADLTDTLMLGADMDPVRLAREVRELVPVKRAGLSEPGLALYNAVLDETCVALVNVVQNLPTFQPRALTEMLGRLSRIETVLDRLPRTSLDAPRGTGHDAGFTGRYQAFISSTLDQLEMFGVDIRRYKPQISVTVAYLSLSVSGEAQDLRIEHALEDSPRTLLRGQAGSGKTTLLQWLAVNAARGTFTGALADWNGSVPFLVRLRSYPDGDLPQPQDLVATNAPPLAGLAPEGWAHRQFASGRALLLVDGVDELRAERRPRVRKWLSELLLAFPRTRVVVTSRPSAAEPAWLTGFRSLYLQPMTPADVAAFCRRWHEAIRESDPPEDIDEYEAALARQLEARRHLRTLASTPLLCALLCALNLDRHKQLPPDRMRLYEASLELLLERRDAERELPVVRDLQLATKSKLTILQHLAWWLTLNGRSEASLAEAVTQVELGIRRMPDVTGDPTVVLKYLLERSGVIREPVSGRIDFIHRTFQEYLAGKQAAEEHLMEFLVRNAHLDQWRETVVMGAGHASVPLRTSLLNALLDRADKEQRHARRLKLVAASCFDTAHTIDPEVTSRVEAALDQLIPPRRGEEARSLSLGGDRVLRKLPRTLDGLTVPQAVACIRTAALVGGQEALRLLGRYAPTAEDKVQAELAAVWQYFPAEQYAAEVLSVAPLCDGTIEVKQIDHVRHLHHLRRLTQAVVDVVEDRDIENLDFLSEATRLKRLRARAKAGAVVDLGPLAQHSELEMANVFTGGGHATNVEALSGLPLLTDLGLPLTRDVRSLDFLHAVPRLTRLNLIGCRAVTDFAALPSLSDLRNFSVYECRSLAMLPEHNGLTDFSLQDCDIMDVPRIASLFPSLDFVSLLACPIEDVGLLAGLDLTFLHLSGCAELRDLAAARQITTLETLMLIAIPVTDLSLIGDLPALRTLWLNLMDPDLTPLADIRHPLTVKLAPWLEKQLPDQLSPQVTVKLLSSLQR
ncbi:NACHT domain-containing protein [Actinocrispum sp. NPDC049592]|uniref:NACHT domain-containing protein n=1 Tax=Actinocrispum sp. NPDC049592 TaxID=3154835 RepID=UPI00342131C8